MIHSRSFHQSAILRRVGRRTDQPTCLLILYQNIFKEKRRSFNDIVILRNNFRVLVKQVMLPKMGHQPSATRPPYPALGIIDWRCSTPDICIVMQYPLSRMVISTSVFTTGTAPAVTHLQ